MLSGMFDEGIQRFLSQQQKLNYFFILFLKKKLRWNSYIKATQNGGLSKEVACHEG